MSAPLCGLCHDADAEWVVDVDLGDREGVATVVCRVACEECKSESAYMEPEILTPAWRRRLGL